MARLLTTSVLMAAGCFAAMCTSAEPQQDRVDRILKQFTDEFVVIRPGEGAFPAAFTMGSGEAKEEKPPHTVQIKHPFALAKYEVTQELYEAVVGMNPSRWKGPRNSVEMVSWPEAGEFCKRAAAQLRERKLLAEREVIRLPTEAEWEYACRAGTTTAYSFGDAVDALKDYAGITATPRAKIRPSAARSPMPGDSTICMVTSGSGARTVGIRTMTGLPRTAVPGRRTARRSGCFVAAHGPMTPQAAAPRIAIMRPPTIAAIRSASDA